MSIRSDELVAKLRLNVTVEDNATDYANSILYGELNDALTQKYANMVVTSDRGYWLKSIDVPITSPNPKVGLPGRALTGVLKEVQIGTGSNPYFMTLPEVSSTHTDPWEAPSNQLGTPRKFVMRGDQVVLLPNPDNSSYTVRLWYYLRPSRLVDQQSSTVNGGTIRGTVTAVNTAARTITVDVVPFDQERVVAGVVTPAAITSANQKIDVIHPDGWHELALVGATQTLAGTTFTVGGTADMSEIRLGDFVRAAEQTDWPCLPDDFHRSLADIAANQILVQRNWREKAEDFAQSASADIARLLNILSPRVRSGGTVIRAPFIGGLRGWVR